MTKSKIGKAQLSPSKILSPNELGRPPGLDMIESTYSDMGKHDNYHY